MKKERKIYIIITLFSVLFLLASVQASIKTNRNNYNTGDSIYVISTIGITDFLCRSQDPDPNVKLFIVEHKDQWSDGDSFEDVRGKSTQVSNSKFSNKKVWDDPKVGKYDLIIDCNEDNQYDEAIEPLYNEGFIVSAKRGSGNIKKGSTNPINSTWRYDSEDPNLINEIFQLKLSAKDEEIDLNNITIIFDSPKDIIELEVHIDKNNDGKLNSGDVLIGSLEYSKFNNIIPLDYNLNDGDDENLLFVINMDENMETGEYSLKVVSLFGTGSISNRLIKFSGTPYESNIMKVLERKTCLGEISLTINPNPTFSSGTVNISINDLVGCDGIKVSIRANDCNELLKKDVDSCVFQNNICQININAIPGIYFACIDKNNDGDERDFGESAFEELFITVRERTVEVEETEETNKTEEETIIDRNPITGSVVQQGNQPGIPLINDNLAILLEVTLLLILFVLTLIFFKLREGSITFKATKSDELNTVFEDFGDKEEYKEDIKKEEVENVNLEESNKEDYDEDKKEDNENEKKDDQNSNN